MNTTTVRNQRIRSSLLRLLKLSYPGALDLKALLFALDNLGYPMPEQELEAHLRYLEEKELVRIESRKGFGFSIAFAALAARGWDLLDGLVGECGVDIEP